MTDPDDPYRPPAHETEEPCAAEALPGGGSLVLAIGAMVGWFALQHVLGWTFLIAGPSVLAAIAGARGAAASLRGLNQHPPPRAGRLLTGFVLMANGLLGSVGTLFSIVSLVAGMGSCHDYTTSMLDEERGLARALTGPWRTPTSWAG